MSQNSMVQMDVKKIQQVAESFTEKSKRQITLSELEKHDGTDPKMGYWTVLYGNVYDITNWSTMHPGGSRTIRLISGRDGTPFIESYHHYNAVKKVSAMIIHKLPVIGKFAPSHTDKQYTIISKSPLCGNSDFYSTVCKRVDDYFQTRHISYNGYSPVFNYLDCLFTLILYFVTAVGMWYHTPYYREYMFAIGHAIISVRCGFLQHMANHRVYNPIFMNEIIGGFMDLLGVDSNLWLLKHQVLHHVAPNILGIDTDVISGNPLSRLHPMQPIKWYHKYQFIYIPIGIGFVSLSWYITEIFVGVQLLLRAVGITPKDKKILKRLQYGFHINWNTFNAVNWFIGKIWVFILHLFLKMYFVNKSDASWTFGVVAVEVYLLGVGLGGTFILNHTQPELFVDTSDDAGENYHWSNLQVRNSANWASGSKFWCWMSGGLNHQIEHHLFPSMHHQNYAVISPIVQGTCEEFNIPYRDEGNLLQCLYAVGNYLYYMGRVQEVPFINGTYFKKEQ